MTALKKKKPLKLKKQRNRDDELPSKKETKKRAPVAEVKFQSLLAQSESRAADKLHADVTVETANCPEDFERILLVHGKSAECWIRYIAYHLSSNNIDVARTVGRRGLDNIPFELEQERLSLWLALASMEMNYGDQDSREAIIEEGATRTDPKVFLVRVAKMYEAIGMRAACSNIFQKLLKKHTHNVGIWKEYLRCMYNMVRLPSAEDTEAGLLLARNAGETCLKAFKDFVKDRTEMAAEIARLEFSIGQMETGLTQFHQILAEKPNRTDIWLQFLNCMIANSTPPKVSERTAQTRGIVRVRRAFMNATSHDIKPYKMKSIYKRWLQYEKEFGNEEGILLIKQKAKKTLLKA